MQFIDSKVIILKAESWEISLFLLLSLPEQKYNLVFSVAPESSLLDILFLSPPDSKKGETSVPIHSFQRVTGKMPPKVPHPLHSWQKCKISTNTGEKC